MEGLSAGCFLLVICSWCSVQRSPACCFSSSWLCRACRTSVNAVACKHGAFIQCSATTFNPLTIKVNNTRHLPAVQYCAGKLRLPTFVWIHLTQTICPKHPCRSSTPTVALALLAGLGCPAAQNCSNTRTRVSTRTLNCRHHSLDLSVVLILIIWRNSVGLSVINWNN